MLFSDGDVWERQVVRNESFEPELVRQLLVEISQMLERRVGFGLAKKY
jgi:hypothetical protein